MQSVVSILAQPLASQKRPAKDVVRCFDILKNLIDSLLAALILRIVKMTIGSARWRKKGLSSH
jgi:hypothetical protein